MTSAPPSRLGIGLDIGGTSIKAGVVDPDGAVVATVAVPTGRGAEAVVAAALLAAVSVAERAQIMLADVDVVGVGVPGAVDPYRGTVHHAVNIGLGGSELQLGPRLRGQLGVPVHVENDVRAAALGADWYVARTHGPVDDLAYLSVGTGIAAGYVEGGHVRRGSRLVAGEIGHIPIDPRGPLCECGQTGCLEAIASGGALERMWPTANRSAAMALHTAAAGGDVDAQRIWNSFIVGLGRAVLMLALTWDPELIVISGGVASLGPVLHSAIAQQFADRGERGQFVQSLELGARLLVIEPTVALGPIGAVRAARAAQGALLP